MEWTRREIQASPEDQEEEETNRSRQQDETAAAVGAPRTTNRRMYDCSFCKRGFTNAQALGGHMNIHRRERAKSKRTLSASYSSSTSSSPTANFANPNLNAPPAAFRPTHHQPSSPSFYPILESQTSQGNYYTYGGFHARADISTSSDYMNSDVNADHEQILGADLSLGLGSMHVGDDNNRPPTGRGGGYPEDDDDLDLELRLGHDR